MVLMATVSMMPNSFGIVPKRTTPKFPSPIWALICIFDLSFSHTECFFEIWKEIIMTDTLDCWPLDKVLKHLIYSLPSAFSVSVKTYLTLSMMPFTVSMAIMKASVALRSSSASFEVVRAICIIAFLVSVIRILWRLDSLKKTVWSTAVKHVLIIEIWRY